MSATLAPEKPSDRNPITGDTVPATLASLGLKPTSAEDAETLKGLLTGIWEVWDAVDQMDDYVPEVDEARFPRRDVRRAEGGSEDNSTNAWAWRCDIRDSKPAPAQPRLLEGRTVSLKDNIAVKGVPMLLGTDVISDYVPNTDATVVTRVLEAGGVVTGKAVCENLSCWGVSTSSATGAISNPWAPGFSAGGSSSGSGALVSSGACWASVGGDQGGSIRIPAAANGIVGLKPTTGLVPYTGIASLASSLDYTGPMTRNVLDNALLLQALAGPDGIDDRSQAGCPLTAPDYPALAREGKKEGLRIGILTEGFDQPIRDDRVSALVRKAAQAFGKLDCVACVEEVSVPMHRDAPNLWAYPGRLAMYTELMGQVSGRRGHIMTDLLEKLHPITQDKFDAMWVSHSNTLVNGKWGVDNLRPAQIGKANNLIRKLKDQYYAALDKYDVLITPTMPMLPQKLPEPGSSKIDFMKNSMGVSLNTSAFNLTGMPALSLPVGFLPSLVEPHPKLPVGMQIIAKFYDEATIYRVALAWEQAFDWKKFE